MLVPVGDAVICRAARIDTLLDFAGKLLVVKIDVETHEEEALDGLMASLDRNHCVLQIEDLDRCRVTRRRASAPDNRAAGSALHPACRYVRQRLLLRFGAQRRLCAEMKKTCEAGR
jgi:hypothetical protein